MLEVSGMSSELYQQPEGFKSLNSSTSWIVEDDPDSAKAIQGILQGDGSSTTIFRSGKELLDAIRSEGKPPDIICLDLSLPDIFGLDLLPTIKKYKPNVPVIIVTGDTSPESIERAVQLGAYDYLPKISDRTKFATTFRRAIEHGRLADRLYALSAEQSLAPQFGIYGVSPAIQSVIEKVKLLAPADVSVLVSGESGTGKELVARALHTASKRKDAPLIAVNCGAMSRQLIESELFGDEGSDSDGGSARHIGAFERAHGGTLLLDEIAELDLPLQAKLIGVIEQKRFSRIGGTREINSDFRLVVVTNRDLLDEVSAGRFRKDLYYRFAVAEINIPALRFRSGEVGLLAHHFIQELAAQLGKKVSLSPDAVTVLARYNWPGNVRELQNLLQFALIQCQEAELGPQHLPPRLSNPIPGVPVSMHTLEMQERASIVESMRVTKGRLSQAATVLGISRATLYRKLKRYGLSTRGQF